MQSAWQKQVRNSAIISGIRRGLSNLYKKLSRKSGKRLSARRRTKDASLLPAFRQDLAKHLYKDTFGRIMHSISDRLLFTVCQAYGMAILSFSLVSAFIYLLKQVFQLSIAPYAPDTLFVVLGMAIISVVLLFFDKPFVDTVHEGKLLSYLFTDILGIEIRRPDHKKKGLPLGAAFLIGALLGTLSVFVSPIRILALLVFAFVLIAIINAPESTFSFLIILMPLSGWFRYGSLSLVIIVVTGLFSYLLKLFLNKRDFSMRAADFVATLGALVYFFGGIISSGGANSFRHGLISSIFLLIYFLAANLFPRENSFYRFFHLLSLCGFFVGAFAVINFFFAEEVELFLNAIPLTYGKGGVGDFFGNKTTLSLYLFFAAVIAPAMASVRKSFLSRIGYFLAFLTALVALFLVASPVGFVALFVATVIAAFLHGKRRPYIPLVLIFLIPTLMIALPPSWVLAPLSFLPETVLSPLSIFLDEFHTAIHLLSTDLLQLLGGVGVGSETVSAYFASFFAGSGESLDTSVNLYLHILVEVGITGLVFLLFLFITLLTDMTHHKDAERNDPIRILHGSVFSLLIAILSVGILSHPLADERIFCLFFCFFGIASALTRLGYTRKTEYAFLTEGEQNSATTDIAVSD